VPTLTPAIRTSSSGTRPDASLKIAEYWVPPPMIGSLAALKAAHSSTAMMTSPIDPIVVGLRDAKDRPRGARFIRSEPVLNRLNPPAISCTWPAGRRRSGSAWHHLAG
jgi:hypothetical protein